MLATGRSTATTIPVLERLGITPRFLVCSNGAITLLMEDFLAVVEKMGLHRVSYAVGWTAWTGIAPNAVHKATAMERVRSELAIPRTGDGRSRRPQRHRHAHLGL